MSEQAVAAPTAEASLPPRPDRREVALKGSLVRDDESVWDFVLANLSYGGCRLETEARLRRGEAVRLFVANRGKIDAVVRWTRGATAGLAFPADETEEMKKPHVPREAERLKTRLSVLVRRPGRRGQWIDARDISPLGCLLEFVDVPRPNDRLWVQLPGLEAIQSRVRWVDDNHAGILFDNPIHAAVYDLLLERWKVA